MDKSSPGPAETVGRWLAAYQRGDHAAVADCYHDQATFRDIAFRMDGRNRIHAMWHMICDNGIEVAIDQPPTRSGEEVTARIIDTYVFSDTGRRVVNPITCHFRFRDNLILQQQDECDEADWARQAIGGFKGWLAGRFDLLRRLAAEKKMRSFISQHPEYS